MPEIFRADRNGTARIHPRAPQEQERTIPHPPKGMNQLKHPNYKENTMGAKRNNGGITKRVRKDGSIAYQAQFKINGGAAFNETFNSEEAALAYLASIANDVAAQAEAIERKERLAMLARAASTPENRQQELLNTKIKLILRGFMQCNLARDDHRLMLDVLELQVKESIVREMTRSWVKGFIDGMRARKTYRGEPYAYATIVRQLATLRQALEWKAEEMEAMPPKIPFSIKKMFPKNWEGKRKRRLAFQEEIALIGRIRQISSPSMHHWRLLIRLALETGARLQELVGMLWSEFSFKSGQWIIPATREKTGKSRTVPFTDAAMRAMQILRKLADPRNPRVFHLLGKPGSVSNLFRRYSREAGLVDFKFHDLRHEAVSRMLVRSPHQVQIRKVVGHSDADMTDIYANLNGDELQMAINPNPSMRRRG